MQYCVPECLEQALHAAVLTAQPTAAKKGGTHRIPLGLQLLSRKQVTESQLREALAEQRAAGRGRIGDWLLEMGFASEQQITAALARQWSSPVLQTRTPALNLALLPQIPTLLLNLFQMIPVSFVTATATLHVAFADGVDHSALYAIERMLDCRTEHCVVPPSLLRESLLALGERRSSTEFVFERVSSISELVSIVSNYAVRVSAREIRLAPCPPYHWVRLECASGQTLNLLLRMPADPRSCPSTPAIGADPAA
jgi:type IV pilus assembly protein PilB